METEEYMKEQVKKYRGYQIRITSDYNTWFFKMVDPNGQLLESTFHGSFSQGIMSSKAIINQKIDIKKEIKKVDRTPLKKLPLLIGTLRFEASKKRFEERLKGN